MEPGTGQTGLTLQQEPSSAPCSVIQRSLRSSPHGIRGHPETQRVSTLLCVCPWGGRVVWPCSGHVAGECWPCPSLGETCPLTLNAMRRGPGPCPRAANRLSQAVGKALGQVQVFILWCGINQQGRDWPKATETIQRPGRAGCRLWTPGREHF